MDPLLLLFESLAGQQPRAPQQQAPNANLGQSQQQMGSTERPDHHGNPNNLAYPGVAPFAQQQQQQQQPGPLPPLPGGQLGSLFVGGAPPPHIGNRGLPEDLRDGLRGSAPSGQLPPWLGGPLQPPSRQQAQPPPQQGVNSLSAVLAQLQQAAQQQQQQAGGSGLWPDPLDLPGRAGSHLPFPQRHEPSALALSQLLGAGQPSLPLPRPLSLQPQQHHQQHHQQRQQQQQQQQAPAKQELLPGLQGAGLEELRHHLNLLQQQAEGGGQGPAALGGLRRAGSAGLPPVLAPFLGSMGLGPAGGGPALLGALGEFGGAGGAGPDAPPQAQPARAPRQQQQQQQQQQPAGPPRPAVSTGTLTDTVGPPWGGGSDGGGTGSGDDDGGNEDSKVAEARRKNREAQQRFRERQRAAARNAEQQFTSMEEEASRLVRENTLLAARNIMLERLLSVRDAMLLAFLPPPGQPATAAAAAAGPGAGQQQQRGAWAAEGRAGAGGAAGPATAGEATSEREGEEEEEMRQQSAGAEAAGSSGLRPAPPSVGQQALEDDGDEPMDLGDPGAPGAGAKDSTRSSDIPDIADLQAADIELQLPHPPAPDLEERVMRMGYDDFVQAFRQWQVDLSFAWQQHAEDPEDAEAAAALDASMCDFTHLWLVFLKHHPRTTMSHMLVDWLPAEEHYRVDEIAGWVQLGPGQLRQLAASWKRFRKEMQVLEEERQRWQAALSALRALQCVQVAQRGGRRAAAVSASAAAPAAAEGGVGAAGAAAAQQQAQQQQDVQVKQEGGGAEVEMDSGEGDGRAGAGMAAASATTAAASAARAGAVAAGAPGMFALAALAMQAAEAVAHLQDIAEREFRAFNDLCGGWIMSLGMRQTARANLACQPYIVDWVTITKRILERAVQEGRLDSASNPTTIAKGQPGSS